MTRAKAFCLPLFFALLVVPSGPLQAQEPLPHHFQELALDSGQVLGTSAEWAVAYDEIIRVPEASWLRLFFAEARLGRIAGGQATVLRITSLADDAVQVLDARGLRRWSNTSAFFNGEAVRVEILAAPNAEPSRLRIEEVMVGEPPAPGPESICGTTDDRILSTDPRAARVVPIGCSVWLIDDAQGCFLTAGHCTGGNFQVVEFDVPLSNSNGSTNHPPPDKQYPVDSSSIQGTNGGVGNDWAYFGTFPNTDTGLTAVQAQGQTYVLGTPPAVPGGETIRITGYGSVSGTQGTPLEWNQVQKTHTGPFSSNAGTTLRYATDTTGGNSGSAVENEDDGTAIGIHTHAGCFSGGGSNQGTSILHPNLQNALANPLGVCSSPPSFFDDGFETGDFASWASTTP